MRSQPASVLTLAAFALALLAATARGQVTQEAGASYVAFEAETAVLVPGTPENWIITNDLAASSGSGILIDGTTSTGDSPHSFAQMRINFKTPGVYYLYYRWRADAARTASDNGSANSAWVGNRFGAFSAPGAQADYIRTDSNNYLAPGNNTFQWLREVITLTYTVGAAETSSVQTLTFGTREAGMIIDRIVLSTNSTLSAVALDALPNSGSVAAPNFNPPSGRYSTVPLNVTVSSDAGSTIFYTTDGSTPTASSLSGTSPVTVGVSANLTLRAFASKSGYLNSPVSSAAYDIVSPLTAYGTVVSNDAPVLYWNFDESFGPAREIMPVILPTTLNDLSPSNTATRVSHDTLGSGLKLGNAANLVEGDFFYAPQLAVGTNSLAAPWAMEFWMQAQDSLEFVRYDYLMGFGTGGNHPGVLYDYGVPNSRYTLEMFGPGRSDGTNGPAIADTKWHHVVVVYYGDGGTGVTNRLAMYVDGALAAPNVRGTFAGPLSLTQLTIGTSSPQFPQDGFWGNLDELAIYDLAGKTNESQVTAKAAQLASHYALGSNAPSPEAYSQAVLAESPLLYWNFNEADGNALQRAPVSAQVAQNNLAPANGVVRASHAAAGTGLGLGNAASFSTNGENFAIGALSFPKTTLSPPYLIEFWMRVKGDATTHPRYDYVANFANNAPAILYDYNGANPNGGLELFRGGRSGAGPSIEDNNWHHVLFAYYGDGIGGVADRLDIYLDGTNAAQNIRATYSSSLPLNGSLVLGTSGGAFAVADGFEGSLDEFAIYDLNALSTESAITSKAADIAARHYAAAPGMPLLQALRSGSSSVITWPAVATGYGLESAPALSGPWSPAGVTPALVNGRWQATVTIGPDMRFFRLHK